MFYRNVGLHGKSHHTLKNSQIYHAKIYHKIYFLSQEPYISKEERYSITRQKKCRALLNTIYHTLKNIYQFTTQNFTTRISICHKSHTFNKKCATRWYDYGNVGFFWHTATHCNTLQHTATHCNTLQHTATHCNTLQHTATRCNTLQHTATHCNMLQHAATHTTIEM